VGNNREHLLAGGECFEGLPLGLLGLTPDVAIHEETFYQCFESDVVPFENEIISSLFHESGDGFFSDRAGNENERDVTWKIFNVTKTFARRQARRVEIKENQIPGFPFQGIQEFILFTDSPELQSGRDLTKLRSHELRFVLLIFDVKDPKGPD
jgi:hypothetical protein